jgi:hypothetical protein
LRELGWTPIRLWEHDPPGPAAEMIEKAVRGASGRRSARGSLLHSAADSPPPKATAGPSAKVGTP